MRSVTFFKELSDRELRLIEKMSDSSSDILAKKFAVLCELEENTQDIKRMISEKGEKDEKEKSRCV